MCVGWLGCGCGWPGCERGCGCVMWDEMRHKCEFVLGGQAVSGVGV